MTKLKIQDGMSIQNYSMSDEEKDSGIHVFVSGTDPDLYGPFVWLEIKGDTLYCFDTDDAVIASSTSLSKEKWGENNERKYDA